MTYELPEPDLYDAVEDVPCHSDETLRAEVAKAIIAASKLGNEVEVPDELV